MNYKIISTDFDGTLLTTDKKVTEKTRKTLLTLKNNNYIIVGITARNLTSVSNVCDIDIFDYLILNNGTVLYDVKNRSENNIAYLKNKTVNKISLHFASISRGIYYFSPNNCYIYSLEMPIPHEYFKRINNLEEIDEKISIINIFTKENNDLEIYKNYLTSNFIDIDPIVMEDSDKIPNIKWLAINPKKVNKLSTLEILCSKLNISLNEVIFFGDAINDLEIIKNVGLGVAVSNALPEVKKLAKKITLSNDENGVAHFLNIFLNNKK